MNKLKNIKVIRPQLIPAGYSVVMSGFIAGKSLEYILSVLIITCLMMIGLWFLDDYVDRHADKLVHPERLIPSGRLEASSAIKLSIICLTIAVLISFASSLILAAIPLLLFPVVILSLGVIAIIISREGTLDTGPLTVKITLTGIIVGMTFLLGGGVNYRMLTYALFIGLTHIANSFISTIGLERARAYHGGLKHVSAAMYSLAIIILWIAYFLQNLFSILTLPLLISLSLCEAGLARSLYKAIRKSAYLTFALTGKLSFITLLTLQALIH